MSLLGKLFSRIAADGDDDFVFRPTRKFKGKTSSGLRNAEPRSFALTP